jgi:hypothetical protein
MPNPFDDLKEDYSDDFAAGVAADIGADLFGGEKAPVADPIVEEAGEARSITEQPAIVPANPAVVPGQNSVAKPLPKSWKKDIAPLWEKADPALHEYVYAREADVMRGIQMYQNGHTQWTNLVQPFLPVLEQHPNVNPVQVMQGLMNTHLQLLDPAMPAAQKAQFAQRILKDYGIDLGALTPTDGQQPANQPDPALLRELQTLRQTVSQLQNGYAADKQAASAAELDTLTRSVEAFAADPKNPYFEEVADDILRFLKTGAATDIAGAYELACYGNPSVRAKLFADQQKALNGKTQPKRAPNGTFVNVESLEPAASRTRKGATMDDTIDQIVASHYPKH